MLTYLFPGQGSQTKGMGEGLFDKYKKATSLSNDILGYSIKRLCLENPDGLLDKTEYTQPAVFVVNALNYKERKKEVNPDFVAGHSLGEYNALLAAEVIDFERGLKIVNKRAELMSNAEEGRMAAVLGLNPKQVRDVLKSNNLEGLEIANYNTPSQVVISGSRKDINKGGKKFSEAGATYIPLNVSGAFHSSYMDKAKEDYEDFLKEIDFSPPKIPVISNYTARPYQKEEIKQNLIKQINHSVRWTESINYLLNIGKMEFKEIGSGNKLVNFVENIRENATETDKQYIQQSSSTGKDKDYQPKVSVSSLGAKEFMNDYNLDYPYLAGGMYKGISSKELVVKLGKAGCLGFLGTGGLKLERIEEDIQFIQNKLNQDYSCGVNLVYDNENTEKTKSLIDLLLREGVKIIEASAFMRLIPSLVKYRIKGLKQDLRGSITTTNKIIAKISRPEVAKLFLKPPPQNMIDKLLKEKKITEEKANLAKKVPMADDLCVEADSGGHTDGRTLSSLLPTIIDLKDKMMEQFEYEKEVRVGAAGGIGTPASAAAAYILGADFIMTGSINQCTVESDVSNSAKDLLQQMNVQDTEYAPAGDMFELGSKVQVLRKGLLFPGRANKLYDLYQHYNSLDEIDQKTKSQIQEKYFKRSFEEVYQEVKSHYSLSKIKKAEQNPKQKMALIFKWYFKHATQLAIEGNEDDKVNYQIHCGPALGAFNQWVKGTSLEDWEQRHVDEIGKKLMFATAEYLTSRFREIIENK